MKKEISIKKVKENNNILKVFQGNEITLDDFKETLSNVEGQTISVELLSNQKFITMNWYEDFMINYYKGMISLDQEDEDKPSTNIILDDIDKILEGYGIMDSHWLVRLNNGLEYFIYETC